MSHEQSPVVHAALSPKALDGLRAKAGAAAAAAAAGEGAEAEEESFDEAARALEAVAAHALAHGGLALAATKRMRGERAALPSGEARRPTLKLAVKATLGDKELRAAAVALKEACAACLAGGGGRRATRTSRK